MNSSTASTSGEAHLLNFAMEKHGRTAWSMILCWNLFSESEVFGRVPCAPTACISQEISVHKIVVTFLNLNSFLLTLNKKSTIKFYHSLAAFGFCCNTCVRFRKFQSLICLQGDKVLVDSLLLQYWCEISNGKSSPLAITWITEGLMQLN